MVPVSGLTVFLTIDVRIEGLPFRGVGDIVGLGVMIDELSDF